MTIVRAPWHKREKKEDLVLDQVRPRLSTLMDRHNHTKPPHWEYDGYSDTAPHYHIYRCRVGTCQMSTIHGCNQKMGLGRCSICDHYKES